jgi:glycosyltransferase involved in cell wall biosynthesis
LLRVAPETANKLFVVPNGFDHDDLAAFRCVPRTDRFVMCYCGEFYDGRRNPESLLRALSNLKSRGVVRSDNFSFTVIGRIEPRMVKRVNDFGIRDLVEFTNYLPHIDALRRVAESSVGLVITMTDEGSRGEMTTKFYECIGLRRPVLAIAPAHFELAQLIERRNFGAVLAPGDCERTEKWLIEQIGRFETNGPPPDLEQVSVMEFSRAAVAAKLAVCANEMVAERRLESPSLA